MNTPTLPGAELIRQFQGNKIYILALARCLPGIAFKLEDWTPEDWDIDRFMKASGPWSSGEKVLARFIASVWNPTAAASTKQWRYDATDIALSINAADRRVILQWIANPVYP